MHAKVKDVPCSHIGTVYRSITLRRFDASPLKMPLLVAVVGVVGDCSGWLSEIGDGLGGAIIEFFLAALMMSW